MQPRSTTKNFTNFLLLLLLLLLPSLDLPTWVGYLSVLPSIPLQTIHSQRITVNTLPHPHPHRHTRPYNTDCQEHYSFLWLLFGILLNNKKDKKKPKIISLILLPLASKNTILFLILTRFPILSFSRIFKFSLVSRGKISASSALPLFNHCPRTIHYYYSYHFLLPLLLQLFLH